MKVTDELIVSFRGLKQRFWYHLGCSGGHADIFSHQEFMVGCMRTVTQLTLIVPSARHVFISYNSCLSVKDRQKHGIF